MGAGTVARSLIEAYRAGFPERAFHRLEPQPRRGRSAGARRAGRKRGEDLETAVGAADIISCATMATEPVMLGDWLQPGQHLDLIGAYRPDMREADDARASHGPASSWTVSTPR